MTEEISAVLDSSALLAYLNNEAGATRVSALLSQPVMMTIFNWSEVLGWYARAGRDPQEVAANLEQKGLIGQIVCLTESTMTDAIEAASLQLKFPRSGLSLADRFCIALAIRMERPIITADRTWLQLKLGLKVFSIR